MPELLQAAQLQLYRHTSSKDELGNARGTRCISSILNFWSIVMENGVFMLLWTNGLVIVASWIHALVPARDNSVHFG